MHTFYNTVNWNNVLTWTLLHPWRYTESPKPLMKHSKASSPFPTIKCNWPLPVRHSPSKATALEETEKGKPKMIKHNIQHKKIHCMKCLLYGCKAQQYMFNKHLQFVACKYFMLCIKYITHLSLLSSSLLSTITVATLTHHSNPAAAISNLLRKHNTCIFKCSIICSKHF